MSVLHPIRAVPSVNVQRKLTMTRYIIIPLAAIISVFLPIPHGVAENIVGQPNTSVGLPVPRLILVQNIAQQCRRECDNVFRACLAQAKVMSETNREYGIKRGGECAEEHLECYRGCPG